MALLLVVWSGFNLEFFGFDRLAQALRGIAIAVTYGLAHGLAHFYPDFAAVRDGGTGYFTGALFVPRAPYKPTSHLSYHSQPTTKEIHSGKQHVSMVQATSASTT